MKCQPHAGGSRGAANHAAKSVLILLAISACVGIAAALLAWAFRDVLETLSSGDVPSRGRGAFFTLFFILGLVGGLGVAVVKSARLDAVGVLVDGPLAVVCGLAAFGAGFAFVEHWPAETRGGALSGIGLTAGVLSIVYLVKVWRDR